MTQVVIENPIINSPFEEPTRHFRFNDEGITNEEVHGRRTSSYFIPIAKPRKKSKQQLQFDTEWTHRWRWQRRSKGRPGSSWAAMIAAPGTRQRCRASPSVV